MHADDIRPTLRAGRPAVGRLLGALLLLLAWGCGPSDGITTPQGGWALLAAGDRHTCAALEGGEEVWCWGLNAEGQVGDGTTTDRLRPVKVFVPGVVVELALGGGHSCARTMDGTVFCWGRNAEGQLGDGTTSSRSAASPVVGLLPASALAAGYRHTCAVEQGGRVVCWGANDTGQLGVGDAVGPDLCGDGPPTPCAKTPQSVLDLANGVLITAGGDEDGSHTCALDDVDRLFCWGDNDERQLGDGTTVSRNRPVQVTDVIDVRELSAGGQHTCAALGDHTAWCWGRSYGSLRPIALLEGVVSVRSGRAFDCVRLEDGSMRCWGANGDGQLADGTQVDRVIPSTVGSLAVSAMALGEGHACAIDVAGSAWCWGRNAEGQLGATSLLFSASPVAVGSEAAD